VSQPEGMPQYFGSGNSADLECGEWYRVEGHIQFFNHNEAAPTRCEVTIRDINGNLIHDANSFFGIDAQGRAPLQYHYDQGRRYYMDGWHHSWKMGNNGPASASGSGKMYDVCCVALADDQWIGSFDGKPDPPPASAIRITPVMRSGEGRVSASAVYDLAGRCLGIRDGRAFAAAPCFLLNEKGGIVLASTVRPVLKP
jgi:hypothetical protein